MILKKILDLISYNPAQSEPISLDCAVCGCVLKRGGVQFNKLFTKSTFNLNHDFKKPGASHVCHYCSVFFSKENWLRYCEKQGKDPYFPRVEGKKPYLANWVFFSHYFAKNDHRIVNVRQDWRDYLLNPPEPPFCYVLSTICKKHLIFKSEMAYNRDDYPVRFEDKIIYVNRNKFKQCLESFEALYSAGLNKSSIRTGAYNSSALLKADNFVIERHEPIIADFRRLNPDYLAVCEFIGAKNAG